MRNRVADFKKGISHNTSAFIVPNDYKHWNTGTNNAGDILSLGDQAKDSLDGEKLTQSSLIVKSQVKPLLYLATKAEGRTLKILKL